MHTETEEARLSRGNGRWTRSVQCGCNENYPQQCSPTGGKGITGTQQVADRQSLTTNTSHTTQSQGHTRETDWQRDQRNMKWYRHQQWSILHWNRLGHTRPKKQKTEQWNPIPLDQQVTANQQGRGKIVLVRYHSLKPYFKVSCFQIKEQTGQMYMHTNPAIDVGINC